MTRIKNDKDLRAAASALADWFVSQGLNPVDASVTMIGVLAATICQNATDRDDLLEGLHTLQVSVRRTVFHLWAAKKKGPDA